MNNTVAAAALAYARRGWRVVPIHGLVNGKCTCGHQDDTGPKRCRGPGKHPRVNDWVTAATSDPKVVSAWLTRWPDMNVGIAFGDGLLDIELDTKNGKQGPATLKALEARLGPLPATHTWRSGGGGLHRVFTVAEPLRGGIEALGNGVDVLCAGRQAVAPPSTHSSGKRYTVVDPRAPVALPKAWVDELRMLEGEPGATAGGTEIDLLDRDPTATIREARMLLQVVPADDYDTWLKVGMALRHQWQDTEHEDAARDLWSEWASKSDKYNEAETQERWEGFNGGGAGWVTFGSVRWLSKEHGGKTRVVEDKPAPEVVADGAVAKRRVLAAMDKAASLVDLYEAAKMARGSEMTGDDVTDVVRVLRKKAKDHGEPMNRQEALALVSFDRRGWFLARAKALSWHDSLFLQVGRMPGILEMGDEMVEHTRDSFNSAYGYKLTAGTVSVGGGKAQAVAEPWDVAVNLTDDDGAPVLPRVSGWGYKPGVGRVYKGPSGAMLANGWAPWDAGVHPMLWSDREADDVAMWRGHLRWMVGDDAARLLEQFLAWPVQRPNQRVRWCYTVLGPEGNGKSMVVHELMANALGQRNVSVVGPADLASPQYNGWANAGAVGCIDELHVDADTQREFAVVNALKPALTDSVLRVSDKYRKAVVVDNVTTWYATSNFMIPFRMSGDKSRRWFFAPCVHRTLDAIRDDLGGDDARMRYFLELAHAARRSSGALRGWLQTVPLKGFDPFHAPACAHMRDIMAASADPLVGHIMDALEEGAPYVGPQVVGIKFLVDKLQAMTMDSKISGRVVARKLADLGFNVALEKVNPWASRSSGPDQTQRTTWYVKGPVSSSPADQVRRLVGDLKLL